MGKKKKNTSGTPLLQKVAMAAPAAMTNNPLVASAPTKKQWDKAPIRILAWGATPYVITGFGTVMKNLLTILYRDYPGKYDVSMVGINHTGDFYDEMLITGGTENGRFRQWPAIQAGGTRIHMYGQHKFLELLRTMELNFDFIFLAEDPFWVGGVVPGTNPPIVFIDEIKKILNSRGAGFIPILGYFPIDGIPKTEWIRNISKLDIPMTYLSFGAKACAEKVPEMHGRVHVVPLGIDPKEFHPINETEKRTFKRAMFGDEFVDKFMFININRNQIRKLVPSTMLAFKEFQNRTNNAGFLYLNMKAVDVGWNLVECCKSIGLVPGQDVLFPPNFSVQKGLSLEDLNRVYSSADVLVTTANGGGWELSVTQAFAAKTAVIAPANTSHIELCGDQSDSNKQRGLLYKSGSNLAQKIIFPHDNEVVRPLPDLDDLVEKMVLLYEDEEYRIKLEENAYKWTQEELSWERDIVPKIDFLFSTAKQIRDQRIAQIIQQQQAAARQQQNV